MKEDRGNKENVGNFQKQHLWLGMSVFLDIVWSSPTERLALGGLAVVVKGFQGHRKGRAYVKTCFRDEQQNWSPG